MYFDQLNVIAQHLNAVTHDHNQNAHEPTTATI
jgi:hypothetical protein